VQLPPAQDEDLAPTLAACLGVSLPDADGKPILSDLHRRWLT
jgi:hypothetical protein